MHPDLMDTAAAAAYLGIATQTLRSARCTKTGSFASLPFLKYGARKVMYRRSDLDSWLDAHRVVAVEA